MLKVGLGIATALVIASVAAVSASGSVPEAWWTTDHAEAALLNSDWAFTNNVDDATCNGWGAARLDTSTTSSSFHRFVCSAYAQLDEQTCLPGECASDSFVQLCIYRLRIQATGRDTFILASVRSSC